MSWQVNTGELYERSLSYRSIMFNLSPQLSGPKNRPTIPPDNTDVPWRRLSPPAPHQQAPLKRPRTVGRFPACSCRTTSKATSKASLFASSWERSGVQLRIQTVSYVSSTVCGVEFQPWNREIMKCSKEKSLGDQFMSVKPVVFRGKVHGFWVPTAWPGPSCSAKQRAKPQCLLGDIRCSCSPKASVSRIFRQATLKNWFGWHPTMKNDDFSNEKLFQMRWKPWLKSWFNYCDQLSWCNMFFLKFVGFLQRSTRLSTIKPLVWLIEWNLWIEVSAALIISYRCFNNWAQDKVAEQGEIVSFGRSGPTMWCCYTSRLKAWQWPSKLPFTEIKNS